MSGENPKLAEENRAGQDIGRKWAGDNQQWWDWYMSLAVNPPGGGALLPVDAPPAASIGLEPAAASLKAPFALADAAIEAFRKTGFLRVPGLLPPDLLLAARARSVALLHARVDGADRLSFPSLELVFRDDPLLKLIVESRRLAKVAADLLGVAGVRLYHDNLLCKNPGCGRTPWHYDAHHYPLDSEDVVTAWFPLQPVSEEMGPLVFAEGMELYRLVERFEFDKHGDAYDRAIIEALRRVSAPHVGHGYALGEVSFHHARSLHSAGPNRTTGHRLAIAITYFADGVRLLQHPTMISGDYEKFMPGISPGDVIDSPLNPLLYRKNG
ncbi:MAG: phytanoyl-CoA dioxygenase family protein [Myxococcota bacterium]